MITLNPFKAEDAFKMDWIETEDLAGMLRNNRYIFECLEQEGNSQTMTNETGSILGIIVLTPYHAGWVDISMFMAKSIQDEFDKDIYKALQDIVNDLTKKYKRVSLNGKSTNDKLTKLIKHLGFEEEGVMRKYGWHGEDYVLYSIVG